MNRSSFCVTLVFLTIYRAGMLSAADGPVSPSPDCLSPITNGALSKEGAPISQARRLAVESVVVFAPGERDWKYSHHQSITASTIVCMRSGPVRSGTKTVRASA